MLYEFAVEPRVLTTWDKCRNTLNLMGFQHARAVAAYPSRKRWKKMVLEACRAAGCPDREFKRIHEKLRGIDGKLLARERSPYDDEIQPEAERWLRNAIAQQAGSEPFRAILATANLGNRADIVLEEDIDESHPLISVPRESRVLREPDALARHIAGLLGCSRRLVLIDPHFDPSYYRWRPVVAVCLKLATHGANSLPHERVEIHALDDNGKCTFAEFEKRCRAALPRMIPRSLPRLVVTRWRLRAGVPDDFHERYVLTERGGYKLGKGLDEEVGVEQPVGLLDPPEWERVWRGYQAATAVFEMDGEVAFG